MREIDKALSPLLARFETDLSPKAISTTPRKTASRKTRQNFPKKPVCVPVLLPKTPEKPDKPVLLRMQHRQDKFMSRKREKHDEGRLLPTTLTGLTKGGYSVMTPYMASVVWSIMEYESVDKSRD